MKHRGVNGRNCMNILTVSLLILAGCAPHYMAETSRSYTPEEFARFSQNYSKMLYTKSGKRIYFYKMSINRDTVYLGVKKSDPTGVSKAVPLSDVKMIGLAPRVSASFWGSFTGIGIGVGISAILVSQSNSFGSSISYAILPLAFGFAGGMTGHGIDERSMHSGYYRIVADGTVYHMQQFE